MRVVVAVRGGDVDGLELCIGAELRERGVGVAAVVLGAEGAGLFFSPRVDGVEVPLAAEPGGGDPGGGYPACAYCSVVEWHGQCC